VNLPEHLASVLGNIQANLDATNGEQFDPATGLFCRAPRKRLRDKADRGLPSDEELGKLATLYLERQRKLWPAAAAPGLLEPPTPLAIIGMVNDMKSRHRGGGVAPEAVQKFRTIAEDLAGAYARFSCENSDPKSISDQLYQILEKAASDKCFVPWSYVYCDFSVSGLDSTRQGYLSYKELLHNVNLSLTCTYIDDFTRASRLELEWWKLAEESKRLRKNLKGASDGFNLADPNSDVIITVYGLVSRLFIKGLQQKVRRGMKGTARENGTLGLPPLGFTRKAIITASGEIMRDQEGVAKTERAADPQTVPLVRLIFDLFVNSNWSPYAICKMLNDRQVLNWTGWTETTVRKILRHEAYIGVLIWNKTHQIFNSDTMKPVTVLNNRKQWVIKWDPSQAIIPVELWKGARRKLGPAPYPKRRDPEELRAVRQCVARWLFHDTMVCGHCGKALRLYRSTSKYRTAYCTNGHGHQHGCKLATSKSLTILEGCMLKFLKESLFTSDHLKALLNQANEYLKRQATMPKANVAPLKRKVHALSASIDKLVRLVEKSNDDTTCEGYHRRIKQLQSELSAARIDLSKLRSENESHPPLLNKNQIEHYLRDLKELLNQDVAVAAPLLRAMAAALQKRHAQQAARLPQSAGLQSGCKVYGKGLLDIGITRLGVWGSRFKSCRPGANCHGAG
jgi:hypothetical protein